MLCILNFGCGGKTCVIRVFVYRVFLWSVAELEQHSHNYPSNYEL